MCGGGQRVHAIGKNIFPIFWHSIRFLHIEVRFNCVPMATVLSEFDRADKILVNILKRLYENHSSRLDFQLKLSYGGQAKIMKKCELVSQISDLVIGHRQVLIPAIDFQGYRMGQEYNFAEMVADLYDFFGGWEVELRTVITILVPFMTGEQRAYFFPLAVDSDYDIYPRIWVVNLKK